MNNEEILRDVKYSLGIVGDYQDNTINQYISEVVDYIKDAGVSENNIKAGLIARGVSDLWNYGTGEGKLSDYFLNRVTQLSYKS